MNNEITLSGFGSPVVVIPKSSHELRDGLCSKSSQIVKVSNAEEQEDAVRNLGELKKMIQAVEVTRKIVKQRPIDLGKAIDQAATDFIEKLVAEVNRVSRLIGGFQEAERIRAQRIRDEEEKRRKEAVAKAAEEEATLTRQLRESQSKVDSEMEQEKLEIALEKNQEQFRETVVQSHAAVIDAKPARSKGLVVAKSWDFEVEDIHAVYKQNSALVKMEINTVVVKSMLKQGMRTCPGLRIFEGETKIGVRSRSV